MNGYIENKTFDEIKIGDTAQVQHTLTQQDIQIFAVMSGDVNPAHVDEDYAKSDMFHKIIAHGMWGGSLVSTVLGTELPGPGTIYLSQTFRFQKPVAVGDTISARVTVTEKDEEKKRLTLDCVCSNQHGEPIIVGVAEVLAPTKKVRRKRIKLPKLALKEERCSCYEQLIALQEHYKPLKTAVVHPVDANSLGGAIDAAQEGLIDPVLVGPEDKIRRVADAENFDLSPYKIISTVHSHAAADKAVELVHQGSVEAIMKGKIHTQELMKPIVATATGLRTGRRMSHVFMVDAPTYHKPLFLTDAAINIRPNLAQKKDIVQNAIDLFLSLGMGEPKVAIVSAVETVDENIPSTLDATALCKMAERDQITGGVLDGPLAFDNAISTEAATAKDIKSPVAGDADIIVVPDVESGNMLYKQMSYLFEIESAGIVVGGRVPVILTSRAAGIGITRKASCALALLYVRRKNEFVSST
ncbi:phosphate acetyltransferase [Pseudovibrio japonicus]|uniref:Phosphate acetyltransferase n=1 Tax=Pseudovibrio japonicus TaxID=366534 RepID=A0ABQ3E400_9HYPH|nr:bifunctional enoyl-CoA hydratase/phosphate acetyltransferase [Pseudovibrio japonicus]GHB20365.1 phosphate acetyltransferase [Pseudovibrio japonicus]